MRDRVRALVDATRRIWYSFVVLHMMFVGLFWLFVRAMLAETRRILHHGDPEPIVIKSGIIATGLMFLLLSPLDVLHSSKSFAVMATMASETQWALFVGIVGNLSPLLLLVRNVLLHMGFSRYGALVVRLTWLICPPGMLVWFVVVTSIMSINVATFASIVYPVFVLAFWWAHWRFVVYDE